MKRAPGTQIKCKQTKAIFAWFEKLKGMIQSKHAALVSEAAHKVDLYLGKEVVKRSIPNEEACDALVDLIKEHGMWKDKEDDEEAAAQEEAEEDAEAEVALA